MINILEVQKRVDEMGRAELEELERNMDAEAAQFKRSAPPMVVTTNAEGNTLHPETVESKSHADTEYSTPSSRLSGYDFSFNPDTAAYNRGGTSVSLSADSDL